MSEILSLKLDLNVWNWLISDLFFDQPWESQQSSEETVRDASSKSMNIVLG